MLVNDILDVETLECRPSSRLFRGSVRSSEVKNGQPQCEAKISFRGKVGFNYNSNIIDTHNSNKEDIT